jgi:hypothetical protein
MSLSPRQIEAQCRHRLKSGCGIADGRRFLVREGMEDSAAQVFVSTTIKNLRQHAVTIMLIGGGLTLAGVFISVLLSKATEGMYEFFMWGPVLVGVVTGGSGLIRWIKLWKR